MTVSIYSLSLKWNFSFLFCIIFCLVFVVPIEARAIQCVRWTVPLLLSRLIVIIGNVSKNTIEIVMEIDRKKLPIIMLNYKLARVMLRLLTITYCQSRNGANMCLEWIFFSVSYKLFKWTSLKFVDISRIACDRVSIITQNEMNCCRW